MTYREGVTAMRRLLLPVFVISGTISVLMLTGSIYMLQVYDRVLSSGSVPTLAGLFVIVIILYAFMGAFEFVRARILSRAAMALDARVGRSIYAGWVGGRGGAPKSPPVGDLDTVRGFLSGPALAGLLDLPWTPLFWLILFVLHPALGVVAILGSVAGAALAWETWRRSSEASEAASSHEEAERAFTGRSHAMSEAVQAMGLHASLATRWRRLRDLALRTRQEASEATEGLIAASKALKLLVQSTILTVGAFLVLQGSLSAGLIIAASVLSGRAMAPIDQVIAQWRAIARARQAHARLLELDDATPAAPALIHLPHPVARLTLNDVVLDVPGPAGAKPRRILHGISLDLRPGDGLGIVGHSASGKSTLARLIVGAATPTDGEIRFDGAPRDQWDPVRLGRMVGYLPQRVDLLPGTIADNIARFDPDATDAAVIRAAECTGLHKMILGLPQGYNTEVGTSRSGVALSGGQIQRVGLARAIYGDPLFVVLDEPNANLDARGGEALMAAIGNLRARGAAVLVIAHRPEVLRSLDTVLALSGGRVDFLGPREDLMRRGRARAAKAADLSAVRAANRPAPALRPTPTSRPTPAPMPADPIEATQGLASELRKTS